MQTRTSGRAASPRTCLGAASVSGDALERNIQLAKAFVVDDFGRAAPGKLRDDFAFTKGSGLLVKERYLKSDDLAALRSACGDTLRVAASDFRADPGARPRRESTPPRLSSSAGTPRRRRVVAGTPPRVRGRDAATHTQETARPQATPRRSSSRSP